MVKSINNIPGKFFGKVALRTYPSAEELSLVITAEGIKINPVAKIILEGITINPTREDVYLWSVSGEELGFTSPAGQEEPYGRAFDHKLGELPPEAIAIARIIYSGDEWQLGGMAPVKIGETGVGVLILSIVMGRYLLSVMMISPGYRWNPSLHWLFRISPDLLIF